MDVAAADVEPARIGDREQCRGDDRSHRSRSPTFSRQNFVGLTQSGQSTIESVHRLTFFDVLERLPGDRLHHRNRVLQAMAELGPEELSFVLSSDDVGGFDDRIYDAADAAVRETEWGIAKGEICQRGLAGSL